MKLEISNPSKLPLIDYRELQPLQGNLKDFTQREYNKLKKSIRENGFIFPFFVWIDKDKKPYIIDGHGRHKVLTREKATPYELPYVEIKASNLEEAKKRLLTATSQYQKITQEGLDEFTFDLDPDWLSSTVDFAGVFNFETDQPPEEEEDKNNYSRKIESPVYEPKGPCPNLKELFDEQKVMELTREIEAATDVPQDIKSFLVHAAQRHRVFDYQKIAEYYAHAPKEVQELMENSALVIIDFDKAIEKGFVKLTDEIRDIYESDYGE